MRNILVYLTAILLLSVSCSDFLEQEPGTQTSTEELFSTYEGFQLALNGCYYDLEDISTFRQHAIYADLLGGNIVFTPSHTSSSKGEIDVPYSVENVYSFQDKEESSDLSSLYDGAYEIINASNEILEHLDQLTEVGDDVKRQLKAETLCIRALCHFYLVRMYSQNFSYTPDASHLGIVCNERTQQVGVDYPARKTAVESYSFVLNDLEDAIDNFTEISLLSGPSYSYFNNISCKALLARVALYANEYQMAVDYCSDVILNSGISLMSKEEYDNQWKEDNAPVSEIIFEFSAVQSEDGTYQTTNTMAGAYGFFSTSDYQEYSSSGDLLSLFEAGDVRGDSMFLEVDLPTVIPNQTDLEDLPYYFTHKFQDNPGNPLMRLSELYLIRAEAYARLDEQGNALSDLNTIRDRAGATPALITDDLLDEIFLERRRELCFEGHLLFDIARFHKNVDRNDGCIANTCHLDYPSNYFVLPIPRGNTYLNSNLVQNEGY
ncbi:RagB/SusD family nutrient uptake outer membrane protein [Saccharicrinis sp. GN24d3]|uniref:RagB/SusD family nutrient uptake outer membrane protein n=1 Tax=Saccharicrinis sp. GN24d3 TaxID=3458416 RepID=UPI004036576A